MVREFSEKFKKDPTSASINYEKIHDVKDPKVRTVRISQKYWAIVLRPEEGDVYVLVWVVDALHLQRRYGRLGGERQE